MAAENYERFKELTFETFRSLAQDNSLSQYEKIGFPNSYREGKEEIIFEDIKSKLKNLDQKNKVVLDIGPGCSSLPLMLIDLCQAQGHTLILVDSEEMLAQLPDASFIVKVPAFYPKQCQSLFQEYANKIDSILAYSLLHYIFVEYSLFEFVDKSLSLLKEGGEMLIGDIPNISKRKRFFGSTKGIKHHQEFTKSDEIPDVKFNLIEDGKIDDAVILSLLMRCRASGFDGYVLPQNDDLPMANRREDILIRKL